MLYCTTVMHVCMHAWFRVHCKDAISTRATVLASPPVTYKSPLGRTAQVHCDRLVGKPSALASIQLSVLG